MLQTTVICWELLSTHTKCTQHTKPNSITMGSKHYIKFIKVQTIHNKLQLWNLTSDNHWRGEICKFPLKLFQQQNMQHRAALRLSYYSTTYQLQLWHCQCIPKYAVRGGEAFYLLLASSACVCHTLHHACDTQPLTILHTQNTQNGENHKHGQLVLGMK